MSMLPPQRSFCGISLTTFSEIKNIARKPFSRCTNEQIASFVDLNLNGATPTSFIAYLPIVAETSTKGHTPMKRMEIEKLPLTSVFLKPE